MSDLKQQVFEDIRREIHSGSLVLPSLPDIAARVSQSIRDAKRSTMDVARIVQADIAITARLIQIANSPLYRGVVPVTHIHGAITRLGMEVTRNLVVSFALRRVFKARSTLSKARVDELWRHSARVAAVSFVLARVTLGFDQDRAMLAGLVHDIGVLPVIMYLEKHPELIIPETMLDTLLADIKGPLGAEVLAQWKFDEEFQAVAREAENWMRHDSEEPDYADIIIVAQLHALYGSRSQSALPPLDTVPAFGKFSVFTLGPGSSLEILREADEDIRELEKLLDSGD